MINKLLNGIIAGSALTAIIIAIVQGKWIDACWPLVALLAHIQLFFKD